MKIALISHHILDVYNKTQYQRARFLCENYEVFIFLVENRIASEVREKARLVKVFPLGTYPPFIWRGFFILWIIFNIFRLRRKQGVDLVYTTFQQTCLLAAMVLKKVGKVLWIADIFDHPDLAIETAQDVKGWKGKIRNFLGRRIASIIRHNLKNADLVISALAPGALAEYSIDSQKILYVTNGVDIEVTQPRNIYKQDGTFRIVYVGYVRKIRGIDTLLQSIAHLKDRISNLKLFLVGPTTLQDREWMYNFIHKLEIAKYVEFVGEVSHGGALKWIERADVCIFPFPRRKELDYIFPIKVFEYLALGKTVVSTRLKGVSSIIVDGKNGLLVEPDDPKAMADAILRIHDDKNLKKKLEQSARETIKEYDWKIINQQISNAIKNLVEERRTNESKNPTPK